MTRATMRHAQTPRRRTSSTAPPFAPTERSGLTCESQYRAEIEAYEDSRSFRETNIAMRVNRAVGF